MAHQQHGGVSGTTHATPHRSRRPRPRICGVQRPGQHGPRGRVRMGVVADIFPIQCTLKSVCFAKLHDQCVTNGNNTPRICCFLTFRNQIFNCTTHPSEVLLAQSWSVNYGTATHVVLSHTIVEAPEGLKKSQCGNVHLYSVVAPWCTGVES